MYPCSQTACTLINFVAIASHIRSISFDGVMVHVNHCSTYFLGGVKNGATPVNHCHSYFFGGLHYWCIICGGNEE